VRPAITGAAWRLALSSLGLSCLPRGEVPSVDEVGPGGGETGCADGADDDGDGLTDCEDGDCAEFCTEDCEQAGDDDGDGLADCEDEDCWGLSICPLVTSSVLGGEMWHKTRERFGTSSYLRSPAPDVWSIGTSTVVLRSVYGSAWVWSSSASSWVGCTWAFDTGSFRYRHWQSSSSFYSVRTSGNDERMARFGVRLSAGCPLAGSAFLPTRLEISGARVNADGGVRYSGFVGGYRRETGYHRTWVDSVQRSRRQSITSYWWTEPLSAGGTWTFDGR
jgi:hypothetical protein